MDAFSCFVIHCHIFGYIFFGSDIATHLTIKRRLEALEAKEAPPIVFVWLACGESEAAALKREGVKPGQNVVVLSWQDGELI